MNTVKMSVAIAFASLALSIFSIMNVAEGLQLPIHWSLDGTADRSVSAFWALLLPPAVMFLLIVFSFFLKFIEPRTEHIKQSRKGIDAVFFGIVLFMLVFEVGYVLQCFGYHFSMNKFTIFAVGLLFIAMGNFFGKLRSNFFIGIKTPWTLSNDEIWRKTHRLAGKLAVIAGVLTAILVWFIAAKYSNYLVLFLLLPSLLIPAIYSWVLWRKVIKS